MKIPAALTGRCLCAFTVVATLVLSANVSLAEPDLDADDDTLAAAAELEALARRFALLDARLTARVESKLEALGDEASRADLPRLTLAHDAGRSGRVDLRAGDGREGRPSAAAPEVEIQAADRSWKIVITSIPTTGATPPAAPLP